MSTGEASRVPPEIDAQELWRRQEHLMDIARSEGASALALFSARNIYYLTGFGFIPTERPVALLLSGNDPPQLLVPQLEAEHAAEAAPNLRVHPYPEYPGLKHPMHVFADLVKASGAGSVAVDSDGYAGGWGYEGPRLSELVGARVVRINAQITRVQQVKSPQEIACIAESCRWGDVAHHLLQAYTRVGAVESDVSLRASHEATRRMLAALGPEYARRSGRPLQVFAGYRGQVGQNSALPHATMIHATFAPGQVLVTGAAGCVQGYRSELERTMVVGTPSPEVKRYFAAMLTVQELAISMLRPGVACREVDAAVRGFFEREGLMPLWRHHTGHAIGLDGHESPFLDTGDATVITRGMVFTVEPGIYVRGLGGFRHSDTVEITATGHRVLTDYPRDLEALVIPV